MFKQNTYDSITNAPSLFVVFAAILILDFLNYYFNPIRLSFDNCFLNISCYLFYYVLMIITIFINTIILSYISNLINEKSYLPSMWYISFFFILITIATYIVVKDEQVQNVDTKNNQIYSENNKNLNPPPTFMPSQKTRVNLYIILLFLEFMLLGQLYYKYIKYPKVNLIINRYLAKSELNLNNYIIMIVVIKIIIDIIMFIKLYTYNACSYNLPLSWNY